MSGRLTCWRLAVCSSREVTGRLEVARGRALRDPTLGYHGARWPIVAGDTRSVALKNDEVGSDVPLCGGILAGGQPVGGALTAGKGTQEGKKRWAYSTPKVCPNPEPVRLELVDEWVSYTWKRSYASAVPCYPLFARFEIEFEPPFVLKITSLYLWKK